MTAQRRIGKGNRRGAREKYDIAVMAISVAAAAASGIDDEEEEEEKEGIEEYRR